jgi:predicted heme/steroid binding protein
MPTLFNYDGKPGYIYNAADDTWYELSGKTDTTGTFEWAGPHTHLSTVTILDHLVAKKGINNYLNPSARDASLTSPVTGTLVFLRQDPIGNILNEVQFYDGTEWQVLAGESLLESIEIKSIMGVF